jgi:hypothetical protein
MRHHRLFLASLSTLAFVALAVTTAAPAAAQYGPQPGSPPPPPPGGGYYQPQPSYYPPPPPPPPGVQRRGFTIGFSIGGGSFALECDSCNVDDRYEGVTAEFHIGGMVTPRIAILFDGWVVGSALNDYQTLFHNIGTVGLRYWATNQIWLQGGLGWANFSLDDSRYQDSQESETGGAVMVAAGFEILQTSRFALDLSLRLGAGAYDGGGVNMGSAQIGFNWY